MTKRPLLDTHVWVWWMLGDPRLPARERDRLDGLPAASRPLLADISLWEVALLVQSGRLQLVDIWRPGCVLPRRRPRSPSSRSRPRRWWR